MPTWDELSATPPGSPPSWDSLSDTAPQIEGGFLASAKQAIGSTIKGAGQVAADFIPGVDADNAVKRYGQSVVDSNPTAIRELSDIADRPGTAITEATGNAAGSMAGMLGVRAIGQGITALSPFAGPAAPVVALAGQAVSWLGPAAIAALPSFGGIRDKQILNDPANESDGKSKAIAALGAGTVGLIESKFGPQRWAEMAFTKEGRSALAEKFIATTLPGSIGKGIAKGASIEGAEELVQNPVEQLAAGDDPRSEASIKDTLFGGAMGAIGGGVLGGGVGASFRSSPQGQAQTGAGQSPTESPPAPTIESIADPILQSGNVDDAIAAAQQSTASGRREFGALSQGPTGFGLQSEFADLIREEKNDLLRRRESLAEQQGVMRESALESADARVEGARQAESRQARLNLLDSIYANPDERTPAMSFLARLEAEFPNNPNPTPEEKMFMARREFAYQAFKNAPPDDLGGTGSNDAPSPPNEDGDFGIKEAGQSAPPAPSMARITVARKLLAAGNRLTDGGIRNKNGKVIFKLRPGEVEQIAPLQQQEKSNGPTPAQAFTGQTEQPQAAAEGVAPNGPAGSPVPAMGAEGATQAGNQPNGSPESVVVSGGSESVAAGRGNAPAGIVEPGGGTGSAVGVPGGAEAVAPDWLAEMFADGERNQAPAENAKIKANLSPLVKSLRDYADNAKTIANDWATRVYKGNDKQIELRGDGPGRNESMSITAANESRRNRNIEESASAYKSAKMIADRIESGDGESVINELRRLKALTRDPLMQDAIATSKQTPDQYFETMIYRELLGDKRASHGGAAEVLRKAFEEYESSSTPEQSSAVAPTMGDSIVVVPLSVSIGKNGNQIITGNAKDVLAHEAAIRKALPGVAIIKKKDRDDGVSLVVGKTADPAAVNAAVAGINAQYAEDVTDAKSRKKGTHDQGTLRGALMALGGINISQRADIAHKDVGSSGGLFSANGRITDLSEAAEYLADSGFDEIRNTAERTGQSESNVLADMIGRMIGGEKIYTSERAIQEQESDLLRERKSAVQSEAAALGLKGIGGKRTLAVVEVEIAKVVQERADWLQEHLDALEQADIAAINERIEDIENEERERRGEEAAERARASAIKSAERDAAERAATTQPEGRAGFALEGQTNEEIVAEEARQQAARESEEAAVKEEESRARKEQAEKDKASTKEKLANRPFVFGESGKDAAQPQRGVFDAPPPPDLMSAPEQSSAVAPTMGNSPTVAPAVSTSGESPSLTVRDRLKAHAKRLNVAVNEVGGGFHAGGSGISIPPEDSDVESASSPDHVFAHEIGHAAMQKRGISYKGFPVAELRKQIPNWNDLIAASKAYRPGVWAHKSDRIKLHARKPNEIIADAIGSVLIGQSDFSLLRGLPLKAHEIGFDIPAVAVSENQPAAPVADSLAPERSASGDDGVASIQGGVAADTPAAQAESVLDAAGISGKERLEALKDVKAETLTVDELKRAYPAKDGDASRVGAGDTVGNPLGDFGEKIGGGAQALANSSNGHSALFQKAFEARSAGTKAFSDFLNSNAFLGELNNLLNVPIDAGMLGDAAQTVDGNSAPSKSGVDSVLVHSKALRNLLQSESITNQGLRSADAKTQRLVFSHVLALSKNLQVLNSVIQLIPVDVMNNLRREQLAPDSLFNDSSVFKRAVAGDLRLTIPGMKMPDALVRAIALSGAEVSSGRVVSDLEGPSGNASSARSAINGNHGGDNTRNDGLINPKETDKGTALFSRAAVSYTDENGLPNESQGSRTLDEAELRNLRRQAAGLERPRDGVFLTVTEDGLVVATGPKGTRIPETFIRFAEDNDLSFEAGRVIPKSVTTTGKSIGDTSVGTNRGIIAAESESMPIEYRESGARYFGESGSRIDRTGKTRFSRGEEVTNPHTEATLREALDKAFSPKFIADLLKTGNFKLTSNAEAEGVIGEKLYSTSEPEWYSFGGNERLKYYDPSQIEMDGDISVWDYDDNRWRKFATKGDLQKFRERNPYAALSSAAGDEKTWFRFGAPPEGNRSSNATDGFAEEGVSVYSTPVGNNPFFLDRGVFTGSGRQVGWGSDGEPLIIPTSKWAPYESPTDSDIRYSKGGQALAFFDPKTGVTHLLFENIPQSATSAQIKGLLVHEIGSHAMHLGQSDKEFQSILRSMDLMRRAGNKAVQAAYQRAVDAGTPAESLNEEVLSYLVESAPSSSIAQRFMTWLKQMVNKVLGVARLRWDYSAADLAAMAQGALRRAPAELDSFDRQGALNRAFSRAKKEEPVGTLLDVEKSWEAKGIQTTLYEKNGIITLSKIIVPKEERGKGIGTSAMQELFDYADKTGQQIALTPSSDFGGNKARLNKFYRRFGFRTYKGFAVRETLIRDPNDSGILYSRSAITGQPINQAWQTADLMPQWDNVVRAMQDKLVDTKRVMAEIRNAGIAVKDSIDPYLREILYHGRASKRVHDFADNELKPLLVEMQARGIDRQELEDYLWARHAVERNAQIAKINPKMPDGGSGLTNQQSADILAGQTVTIAGRDIKIDPARTRGYQSLAARIDAINKETTDTLVRYGLEKQETVDAWRKTYAKYVPLMRDMESDDNYAGAFNLGLGTGQGFSVRGSASKRALGSQRGVIDILANVAMQRERAIVRGEKNRIAQALYGLTLEAPNPDFWLPINPDLGAMGEANDLYAQIQKDKAEVDNLINDQGASVNDQRVMALDARISANQTKFNALIPKATALQNKVIAELVAMGINPIDAENIAREPKQRYVDPRTGMVAERVNPQLRTRPDVLAVRVNGQDRYVLFSSDERAQQMVRNLKNLDAEQLGFVTQNVAVATRYFASINTQYNPVFGLTNGIRDLGTGMLNLTSTELKGHQAEVFKGAFSALRGIYSDLRDHRKGIAPTSSWALEYEEFAKEGGQTGYRDMFQTSKQRGEAIAKELENAGKGERWLALGEKNSHLFGWLSDYNTAIENAVRVSAYRAAKKKGMSKERAAALAKGLTVNFNKKGLAATQTGALYAFFNAAVQGTARIGETLLHVENGKPSLTAAGKKIIYGGMMAGVLQAVMFALAGYDDEEPPQFVRERNFIIPGPDGKYISIPYPLGFHVIPGIGRIGAEFTLGGFKNPGKRLTGLASMIMDGFNPIGSSTSLTQMIMPTVADPIAALAENRDWTGKSIYREDFNKLHPTAGWTRTKNTASDFSKALAYGINYATGGGKYEIGIASPTPDQIDYLIGQATGGVGRQSLQAYQFGSTALSGEEMPMYKVPVAGRFIGETTGQASETSKFYENLKRIGAHKSALDEMQDAKDTAARIRYIQKHPDALKVKSADSASRELSDLNKKKRALMEKNASKDQIKIIEMRITALVKRWNERLSERG